MSGKDDLVKNIEKLGDVEFMALLGVFVDKDSPVDLLVVGNIDKVRLQEFLNTEINSEKPIRSAAISSPIGKPMRSCAQMRRRFGVQVRCVR